MSPDHPSVQSEPGLPEYLAGTPLTPEDVEQVLKLLCNGAILQHSIHLTCYVLEPNGSVRDLGLGETDPFCNDFCLQARTLAGPRVVCARWYEKIAQSCRDADVSMFPRVLECPFGLSVMVAPVTCQGLVRLVLFTGNWREAGAEGMIHLRLDHPEIFQEEKTTLAGLVPQVPALPSEEIDAYGEKLKSVVGHVSRLIGLVYAQDMAVRVYSLTQAVGQCLPNSPATSLDEMRSAYSTVLAHICDQLDIEFTVFFTNTGLRDRLDAWSWSGLTKNVAEGLCLRGPPKALAKDVGRWSTMSEKDRADWLHNHLAKGDRQKTSKRLRQLDELLPVEIGPTFCGVLAIGPRKGENDIEEQVMNREDHHGLVHVAHRLLRNGLRDVVERQEVAEVLVKTSHILRGPLMGIQGEIEALKHYLTLKSLDRTAIQEISENIQGEVDDIAAQAELMEAAKRIGHEGGAKPWFQRGPLAALVDKVSQGMTRIVRDRSMQFGSLKAIRALPDVEFDWNQMRVVFANLLHNACKYAHNRTTIEFVGQRTLISGKAGVRISVVNFGTGISPTELADDIFKPGFRGSVRDEKRDIEGAGMGLAVCKDIVENVHHGRIHVRCTETGQEQGSYQHCRVELMVDLPIKQAHT